jgi:hypothetical protein
MPQLLGFRVLGFGFVGGYASADDFPGIAPFTR